MQTETLILVLFDNCLIFASPSVSLILLNGIITSGKMVEMNLRF